MSDSKVSFSPQVMMLTPEEELTPRAQLQKRLSDTSTITITTKTPTSSHVIPQLPSPPETLDSAKNSSFFSTSTLSSPLNDNNPPIPSTPPHRGRPDPRYPDSLGPGRVPLHRRGTSKTYERLEDLLREAGYKDTRVFTPEAERAEIEAEERKERERSRVAQNGSMRGGVGVVVGFLTGLVSRTPSQARDGGSERRGQSSTLQASPLHQEYSPPPSPLAHKQQLKTRRIYESSTSSPSLSPTTAGFTSSAESLHRSPRGSPSSITSAYRITNSPSSATPRAQYGGDHYHYSHSRPSRLRPQPSFSSNRVPQTYAEASKARVYLRHMASVPTIQTSTREPAQRQSSTRYPGQGRRPLPNGNDRDQDEFTGRRGNGEGEEETETYGQPPLPKTWLESVARAVLFGGSGAHIGGPPPSSPSSQSRSPKPRRALPPMSPSSKSVLSDHTNTSRRSPAINRARPLLCAQVISQRTPSESRVSRARVICRSAPASRSSSRVRGGDNDTRGVAGKRKEKGALVSGKQEKVGAARKTRSGKGADGVPTLTKTTAHNDGWTCGEGDTFSSASSSEEEEEGELDLARLLVPPKRQNSIRSLRRHLHSPSPRSPLRMASGSRSANGSMRARRKGGREIDDPDRDGRDDWHRGGGVSGNARNKHDRENRDGEGEGERESHDGFLGTETLVGAKQRRAIPGGWAPWSAGI